MDHRIIGSPRGDCYEPRQGTVLLTPAPVDPASSEYNSCLPLSLAYPLICIPVDEYVWLYPNLMLKFEIARLAARGREGRELEEEEEEEKEASSMGAGPVGWGGTSGVRARKRNDRRTFENMV